MKVYETLSEAVNDLSNNRGYSLNFVIEHNALRCVENHQLLTPEEFTIEECHIFQQMSDVDDETILYVISSPMHNLKGLWVNAYGTYADPMPIELAAKLSRHVI